VIFIKVKNLSALLFVSIIATSSVSTTSFATSANTNENKIISTLSTSSNVNDLKDYPDLSDSEKEKLDSWVKYEDASTLLKKDTENIKIKKSDFEKLKISALKACEQHNLYATVSNQIETLTKLRDEYKQEKEFYYRKYNGIKYKYDSDMHCIKLNHEKEIESKNGLIKEFEKFIEKNNLIDEFKSYCENLKERKIHKKVKSQNINNEIEI